MNPTLTDKQSAILKTLRVEPRLSQRELARRAGVSLGTVNLLLRRLEADGLVRGDRGSARPSYSVTARGDAAAVRDSYDRASRALRGLSLLQKTVQVEVLREYARGERELTFIGDGELARLAESAVAALALGDLTVRRLPTGSAPPRAGMVLVDAARSDEGSRPGVRTLGELAGAAAVPDGGVR